MNTDFVIKEAGFLFSFNSRRFEVIIGAERKIMKAALEFLAGELAGKKVEALLIGGHALAAYGVMRQTLDVDIAEEARGTLKNIFYRPDG